MNKKYKYLLIAIIIVSAGIWVYIKKNSCRNMNCKIEAKCKGHYSPVSDTLNTIKANSTIVFVEYERDGVAQHDYEYYKNIDPAFFKNIDEESFRNDDEAGGYLATVRIYKALKPGDTEIEFYKKPSMYQHRENDTASAKPETIALYKFHIE